MKFGETIAASDRKRQVLSIVGALLLSAASIAMFFFLWASIAPLCLRLVRIMPVSAIRVLSHSAWMLPLLAVFWIVPFSRVMMRKQRSKPS